MKIETKKASYKDAGEMLKGYTFDFSNENYSDDYKVTKRFFDGTNELGATCFAMIEYVEDGLLRKVRFINTYRETAIDIEIINADELDGSEEDIDGDNVFDLLPALDELNDVDIDDDDNTPPDSEPMSDDISDICKRTSEVDPAEYAINAEKYAREIPQHNPCSQIKQFFIGDTENHRAELVTFEGDRWEIIKSNYYGAEMYNGTDNKIHFIVGEFYDDTTGKYFPEPERGMNTTDADEFFSIMQERGACTIDNPVPEIDPDEYAISEAAMEVAINAEGHNADVASGNYSVDINGEYVWFENHSIVRIDAMRKMNWIYDHTGKNKIFRYGNRKSSAAKVIDMYMNGERAKEQGEYFREFFIPYNKARGTIEVWVILTYADGEEHTFRAEFNQGRLADKFIATGGGVALD